MPRTLHLRQDDILILVLEDGFAYFHIGSLSRENLIDVFNMPFTVAHVFPSCACQPISLYLH